MSIGNHECRLLVDKYPGSDSPRVDRSTVRAMVFNATSTIFKLYMVVSFIGGGNRSIRRKPPTCHNSLTNFITKCCIEYTSPDRVQTHNVIGDRH